MKKKGVEISVKFLVMIIISLIVFIFALTFAFRFFGQAEEYQRQVEQSTRQEIENIVINQGYRVAAYPTQMDLYGGQSEVIGLGIFSIGFEQIKTFKLYVNCTKFINISDRVEDMGAVGSEVHSKTCGKIKTLFAPSEVDIDPNDDYIYGVYIKNDGAWRGTYILNALVVVDGNQYGDIQKIYVKSK